MKKLSKLFESAEVYHPKHEPQFRIFENDFHAEDDISQDVLQILDSYLSYLKHSLDIESLPTIKILSNRLEGMTYGAYSPKNDEIFVLGKNRGLADVFRTLAHELVHYKQKLENKIPDSLDERNLELEGEANTKAGDLIYMFGLQNPSIYQITV